MPDLPSASQTSAITAVLANATTYYLALYTADPGTTGAANEVAVAGYARQPIQFTNGVSTSAQNFTPTATISNTSIYIGIWTASSGGTFKWGGTGVAVTGPVAANATITFAIGAVTASVS